MPPNSWTHVPSPNHRRMLNIYYTNTFHTRDLNGLIADLQRMRQIPNEGPLTFINRIQTHESRMLSVINKQCLSVGQKYGQTRLIESLCLDSLLTNNQKFPIQATIIRLIVNYSKIQMNFTIHVQMIFRFKTPEISSRFLWKTIHPTTYHKFRTN